MDRRLMGVTVSSKYHTRLAEIETWLRSLPPGTAEMRVEPTGDGRSGTYISIRPLERPDAASIGIRIDKESGFAYLDAGRAFAVDDIYWESDLPLARLCQAIVSGGLTEMILLCKGREVNTKGWLQVPGEERLLYSNRISSLRGQLRGAIFGRGEERTINYPPYYQTANE